MRNTIKTFTQGGSPLNIYIRVKAAGKRRDMLEKQSLAISGDLDTTEKLIAYLVRENVRAYNERAADGAFFRCLSQRELEDGVYTGKVGFGGSSLRQSSPLMNEKQADEEEAVRNALQCFEDGIFRIVLNDTELEGKKPCALREGDTLTFIRLVMLAGRLF